MKVIQSVFKYLLENNGYTFHSSNSPNCFLSFALTLKLLKRVLASPQPRLVLSIPNNT